MAPFQKVHLCGVNSLVSSTLTYSAVVLRVSRVQFPALGPFPISSPCLSPTSLPVWVLSYHIKGKNGKKVHLCSFLALNNAYYNHLKEYWPHDMFLFSESVPITQSNMKNVSADFAFIMKVNGIIFQAISSMFQKVHSLKKGTNAYILVPKR